MYKYCYTIIVGRTLIIGESMSITGYSRCFIFLYGFVSDTEVAHLTTTLCVFFYDLLLCHYCYIVKYM